MLTFGYHSSSAMASPCLINVHKAVLVALPMQGALLLAQPDAHVLTGCRNDGAN